MNERYNLMVDGVSLMDYGVAVTDGMIYSSPTPKFEKIEVPGRNGDLTIDEKTYSNFTLRYPAVIMEGFRNKFPALRDFLMSLKGYVRIEDSYTPDLFRMGRFIGEIDPEVFRGHQSKLFEIKFWVQPQWYLKSGEIPITISEQVEVYNPTYQTALPKIEVTAGTGALWIDDQRITITANNGALIIDSQMQNCYEGTTNRNSAVSFSDGEYPQLGPGRHTITPASGMTIKLTPRWWRV